MADADNGKIVILSDEQQTSVVMTGTIDRVSTDGARVQLDGDENGEWDPIWIRAGAFVEGDRVKITITKVD